MKILLSLCMILSFASLTLAPNGSGSLMPDAQEKITTGLNNNSQQPASKDFVKKYMIPGLNIASTGAAVAVGAKLYNDGYLVGFVPFFVVQSVLNTASMIEATNSSPANTIVGSTNLVWAGFTFFAVKSLSTMISVISGDPILPLYCTCQAAVSAANAVYKLWYVKKQQN